MQLYRVCLRVIFTSPVSYNQTAIKLQLSDADKASMDDILDLKIIGMQGNAVPIRDLVTVTRQIKQKNIYRKNQKEVVYVLADMSGKLESPSYAIANISDSLKNVTCSKRIFIEGRIYTST